MDVHIVIDQYGEDGESIIYGVFSTNEAAEAYITRLEDAENNEWGQNLNKDDTITIESYTLNEAQY